MAKIHNKRRLQRPLAVTLGDPCGIGPEVAAALVVALASGSGLGQALFVGSPVVLATALQRYPGVSGAAALPISTDLATLGDPAVVTVAAAGPDDGFAAGAIGAAGGAAAISAVEEAHRLCSSGVCAGMVTAPIGKKAIRLAGSVYSGHTDMLCALTGVEDTRMAMVHRRLRVVMSTLHISWREVLAQLTVSCVYRTLVLAHDAWATTRNPQPKIAVGGLNPHAGEDGLFGCEETTIIKPAMELFREHRPDSILIGPYPCDSLFTPANRRQFEVFVAHTHDQGLIAIKALAPLNCVNVTLGLPYVRTSVGHGAAYALAGTGRADGSGMLAAWREARKLALSFNSRPSQTREHAYAPDIG